MWASRGIAAGAVFATVELRLLLIESVDAAHAAFPHTVSLTVYVDDTSIEAVGSEAGGTATLVQATRLFTSALQDTGMAFSATKNVVTSSRRRIAQSLAAALPSLAIRVVRGARSLGAPVMGTRRRFARTTHLRAAAFRVRRRHFQKLRRTVGSRRVLPGSPHRRGGLDCLWHRQRASC